MVKANIMTYRIELEVAEDKLAFAEEFFKSISFIRRVRMIPANEITNPEILESIAAYEAGKVRPTPLNLSELKSMLDA